MISLLRSLYRNVSCQIRTCHRQGSPSLSRWPLLVAFVAVAMTTRIVSNSARASCNEMRQRVPMEVIQESGPWRCIEIPGYLVFTRLPDNHSLSFARDLQFLTMQLTSLGIPPQAFRAPTNQIPVVLRVPSKSIMERAANNTLGTIPTDSMEIYADEISLLYIMVLPDVVPIGGQGPGVPLFEFLGGGQSSYAPGPMAFQAEMLARDAYARRMNYAHPAPPIWFREGMAHLMSHTKVSPTGVTFGAMRNSAHDIGAEEFFTVELAEGEAERDHDLVDRSELFLRWALTGTDERRGTFWKFVEASAASPVTEDRFNAAFEMSFGELDVELGFSRLSRSQNISGVRGLQPLPVEIRLASEEEATRLLRTAEDINERVATHNAELTASR